MFKVHHEVCICICIWQISSNLIGSFLAEMMECFYDANDKFACIAPNFMRSSPNVFVDDVRAKSCFSLLKELKEWEQ